MGDASLAWLEFKPHFSQPFRDDLLALLYRLTVLMHDREVIRILDHQRCPKSFAFVLREFFLDEVFHPVKSNVCQERRDHSALWSSRFRGEALTSIKDTSLQPRLYLTP